MNHESEPIEVSKDKTWQEVFQEKLAEVEAEKKDPAAVVYYEHAMKEDFPGPSWEQFHDSIIYQYWEPEHEGEIEAVRQRWVEEALKS